MSVRIGVLISGSGTNLQALIDRIADGSLDATIELVVSSRPSAYGLKRAEAAGIQTLTLSKDVYADPEQSDEIIAAVNSMLGQVDAVFTPTDNAVQATELAIAPILAEAGIPHYAGADSFVRNGAFATCGVNYTDLGTQTADLALEVLQTGEFPEYVTVSGDIITVNTDTAATLGLDYSLFQDMGSQVVEVQTTQD